MLWLKVLLNRRIASDAACDHSIGMQILLVCWTGVHSVLTVGRRKPVPMFIGAVTQYISYKENSNIDHKTYSNKIQMM